MTAVPVTAAQRRTSVRRVSLLGALSLALLAAVVVAAGRGQLDVAPAEVVGSLLHRLGLDLGPMPSHPQGDVTLWTVRFPRVVMAAVAGAAINVLRDGAGPGSQVLEQLMLPPEAVGMRLVYKLALPPAVAVAPASGTVPGA